LLNIPSVLEVNSLTALSHFKKSPHQLGIVRRQAPKNYHVFFEKIMQHPFNIFDKIYKKTAEIDIKEILLEVISNDLLLDPCYENWIMDMGNITKAFCNILDTAAVGFWLGSKRGCKRYHVDNVPLRMLVTYTGTGTEWLPHEAVDLDSFERGEPNEKIVINQSVIQFLNPWDISVFKGGSKGILHRTPDEAMKGSSLLMRLDHPSFWEKINQQNQSHASSL
jgi:hypothetical protein